jgi:hypothetical protein
MYSLAAENTTERELAHSKPVVRDKERRKSLASLGRARLGKSVLEGLLAREFGQNAF